MCRFCALTDTLPSRFVFTVVSILAVVLIFVSFNVTATAIPPLSLPMLAIEFILLKSLDTLTASTSTLAALIIAPLFTSALVCASSVDFNNNT